MAYYQLHNHKSVEALKKKQRIKVVTDSESEIISMSDIIHDIVSSSEEYIDKYSEKENIAIEIEEKKPGAGQRPQDDTPHQLTIKVHRMNEPKKVTEISPVPGTVSAVIEHHRETSVPSIEISAHNKHGHVRQH